MSFTSQRRNKQHYNMRMANPFHSRNRQYFYCCGLLGLTMLIRSWSAPNAPLPWAAALVTSFLGIFLWCSIGLEGKQARQTYFTLVGFLLCALGVLKLLSSSDYRSAEEEVEYPLIHWEIATGCSLGLIFLIILKRSSSTEPSKAIEFSVAKSLPIDSPLQQKIIEVTCWRKWNASVTSSLSPRHGLAHYDKKSITSSHHKCTDLDMNKTGKYKHWGEPISADDETATKSSQCSDNAQIMEQWTCQFTTEEPLSQEKQCLTGKIHEPSVSSVPQFKEIRTPDKEKRDTVRRASPTSILDFSPCGASHGSVNDSDLFSDPIGSSALLEPTSSPSMRADEKTAKKIVFDTPSSITTKGVEHSTVASLLDLASDISDQEKRCLSCNESKAEATETKYGSSYLSSANVPSSSGTTHAVFRRFLEEDRKSRPPKPKKRRKKRKSSSSRVQGNGSRATLQKKVVRFADNHGREIETVFEIDCEEVCTGASMKRVLILLLLPNQQIFEHVRFEYADHFRADLISDILQELPSRAVDPAVSAAHFIGLMWFRRKAGSAAFTKLINTACIQSYKLKNDEVLIAVPDGHTPEHVCESSRSILQNKKLLRMLKRHNCSESSEGKCFQS